MFQREFGDTGQSSVMLDIQALRRTPLAQDPFDHCIVPGFLSAAALPTVHSDFPDMSRPGSFPAETLAFGAAFASLLKQIQGPEMTAAIAEKFSIDLAGRPTMVTVRGQCRARDGQIHTDSGGKLITALLYMNPEWEQDGGRLRLLRSADNIEDYVVEVPPAAGTLLVFRCSENAWHGHKSVEGERRMIQLNWVRDRSYLERERRRHKVSAFFKRFALAS